MTATKLDWAEKMITPIIVSLIAAAVAFIARGPAKEFALWNEVSTSNNPREYDAYIDRYPNGVFSNIAIERRKELSFGFVKRNDGTLIHSFTNLEWTELDNGYDIDWSNAKIYCEKLSTGGNTDWALPNRDYVGAHISVGFSSFNGITTSSNGIKLTGDRVWTADSEDDKAWNFNMANKEYYLDSRSDKANARAICVREPDQDQPALKILNS
ncbi:MAG: DUF1566 domain-containing protein [Deltaproteobacteria bacterium]|nr:DUF1566 domain-containing protein [Deltaproteobacteria bacterium]